MKDDCYGHLISFEITFVKNDNSWVYTILVDGQQPVGKQFYDYDINDGSNFINNTYLSNYDFNDYNYYT